MSVESAIVRPPRTGLRKIRIRAELPAAYATTRPLGESAGKIAETSGRRPKDVKDLITVGKSAAASAAASQYDLDLPQILVVAEFDGDEEAQRRLHEALRVGNFAHVAPRLRDARAEREAKEQFIADAAAQGVAVVDNAGYGCTEQPLTRLGLGSDEAIQQHRESCVGHVRLPHCERSEVAALAAVRR